MERQELLRQESRRNELEPNRKSNGWHLFKPQNRNTFVALDLKQPHFDVQARFANHRRISEQRRTEYTVHSDDPMRQKAAV